MYAMFLSDAARWGESWRFVEDRPANYGWYHIMWLCIMVLECVGAFFLAKKHSKKIDKWLIFGFGAFLLVIEIYKQIIFTVDAGRYQWYAFPFVFCSIPLYICLLVPFLKPGKIQDACYKFIAFFGLLAGLSCMLYPDSVFATDDITILIHTMLWHTSLVVIGFYLIVSKGYGKNYKNDLVPGFYVYFILVAIAVIGNDIGYYYMKDMLEATGDCFWLLHISSHYTCPLPVLNTISDNAPYSIFIFCYVLAFTLGISVVFYIVKGIRKLCETIKNNSNKKVKE